MFWKRTRVLRTGAEIPLRVLKFRKLVYALAFLALLFIIVESGFRWRLPSILHIISLAIDYVVFLAFLVDVGLAFYYTYPKNKYLKENWLDVLVFVPIILNMVSVKVGAGFIVLRNVVVILKVFTRSRKFSNVLRRVRLNAAQMVVMSFLGTILIGTILLTFPAATMDGLGTSFIDALFTATSATCVTGLIVQDTPTYFSVFGQVVILVLIQLGGLGIMTYSAFIALLFGRFSLGQRKIVQEMYEEDRNILNMIIYIIKMTFLFELVGCILLWMRWIFFYNSVGDALYASIFHSISAFCNAGFSLFSDSLMGFDADPVVNIVIMGLIIAGGLGFVVVYESVRLSLKRNRVVSLHTKLVLSMTLLLILFGFFIIFFFEFEGTLSRSSIPTRLLASLFQSITTRTAGFNTIDIASLSSITLTVMIILMLVGASPGSTGGGIKTSTFAIIMLSIRSIVRGEENITVMKRTIPGEIILKSLSLLVSALILISIIFSFLLICEDKPYLPLLFETVSAFGTVGLSMGITSELTHVGKFLILVLMFLGRIGPLTLVLALSTSRKKGKLTFPEAHIMIG